MFHKSTILILILIVTAGSTAFGQQIENLIKSRPFQVSGNIHATSIFYNATGIPNRYLPFNYIISGTPIISLYGFQIPVSFIIGKQQSSFTQPFNQFGLSPSYKWLTIHAGYRNLMFSTYTLAGHTFLGGGIEINPGKFRFAAMYGVLNKATLIDTAQQLFFSNFSYKRTGMAVKLGYGNENNYFELIGLKAKDDPGSLKINKSMIDSSGVTPAENLVAGYNMHVSILKQRLILETNGAISLYTNDVNAPKLQDSSFDKNIKQVNSFTTIRNSSELFGAIDASLRYKLKYFSLKLQYRHVDAGFQSMGAYFLNNDLENYTIAPSFIAFKRRLRFSGSLGMQKDDLAHKKRARADKVIGSANAGFDFTPHLGLDASYSNYSVSQTIRTIRFADSLKVVQSSAQLSVVPRYTIQGLRFSHTLILSANLSTVKELNPARTDSLNGNINTSNYVFNYQVDFMEHQASAYISLNHTQLSSSLLKDENNGITLGGTKNWLKDKLTVSASSGWLLSKRNEEKGRIITGSLQARYRVSSRHQLSLISYYTDSRPNKPTPDYPAYSEVRAELGYQFSLQPINK